MASRPELVQICMELGIDWSNKSIQQMKEEIRKEADKQFSKKRGNVSADNMSDALKMFLTKEYDYIIKDKDGNLVN